MDLTPHCMNSMQRSMLPQFVYNSEALNTVSAIKKDIVALAKDYDSTMFMMKM
jgi:hypothetical protein